MTASRGNDTHCPSCGAPAERGQLVCLECGARIALVYRRPPSWKVPAAITALVAVLLGIAAVLAVSALSDDAEREVAAAPPRPRKAPAKTASERPKKQTSKSKTTAKPKPKPKKKQAEKPKPATDTAGLVKSGALYRWPRTLEGFTVVINSTEDRGSATTFARSAAQSKPAKLGVIRAADFKTLPKGFFVVFAGYYKTRARADQATARLGRTYPGAFTQRVKR